MAPDQRPIGVFDSGVGGLTVVRALRATLPGEDIVYLGDTARVPYGSKSPRTVERYSLSCQRFLLGHGVKLVVVACNTASSTALPALMESSPVPVIGAVEPGAESALAASTTKHVGVIGTLATVRSGSYERAITERDRDAVVTALACPILVPLAEEGWTDDEVAAAVARRYLGVLFSRDRDIDTLVLGCTHYPLLTNVLARTANELASRAVRVVDSATAMADAAERALERRQPATSTAASGRARDGLGRGQPTEARGALHCYVTDASRLDELGPRFLGEPLSGFELVDL